MEYPMEKPGELDRMAEGEMTQRRKQIDAAWAYYEGNQKRPLKVRPGQPDDNVILNVCRKTIEQAVALLFGEPPTFEIGSQGDDPEDEALEALWAANDAPIFLHNLALEGALTGHVFVKLAPVEGGVRFVLLNPRMVTVYWRPDDMDQVTAYSISFEQGDTSLRQDIVNLGGSWLVRDLVRERGKNWAVMNEVIWGFPWAPIVEWQNLPDPEEYYGDPDLVRPELNDALNFLASNTMRILKFHAHPKTIGTGMRSTDLQATDVDGFWSVPNSEAQIKNLEMQSDLGSSMAFLTFLQGWFFSEHRAVDMSTFAKDMGNITNFGLRTLYKDALDKLATKRALYGTGLADISERALALMGWAARPVVTWPDPLPFNDQEEIAGIQTEMGLGILSKETAASLRGRNWEQEQERIADEEAMSDNIGNRLLAAFERGQ
jgi:hypothetical protein